MSKTYEVTISTGGDNTQVDIQQALTTEVSRQATAAQQEYLAALVGGVVDERCKKMKEGECDCDDPDDCDCDDDGEDLDEASKLWYIGRRSNPQLDKPYYVRFGRLSKSEVKKKEASAYGSMSLTAYTSLEDYEQAYKDLEDNGFRVTTRDGITEATFKKMDAKQFTDLTAFKTFVASYQKDVDGIEVKRQQLAGVWKWFVYKDTDVIGTFDEGTGRGYIMAMVEGK